MAIVIKEIIVRTTVERGKSKEINLTDEWRTYIQRAIEEQLRFAERKIRKKGER